MLKIGIMGAAKIVPRFVAGVKRVVKLKLLGLPPEIKKKHKKPLWN
ncbi:hypothetical protein KF7HA_00163 [Lactococcus lactis]|nr:hypothetical protein [Lactococcus lactis]